MGSPALKADSLPTELSGEPNGIACIWGANLIFKYPTMLLNIRYTIVVVN